MTKQFLISEKDLERIKSLKDHPLYKKLLAESYARIEGQLVNGIEPWEGNKYSHNRWAGYLNLLDMGLLYLIYGDKKMEAACVRDVMTFIKVAESNSENAMSESKIEQTLINRSLLFIFDWMRDSFSEQEKKRIKKMILAAVPRHLHALGRWCIQDKLVQNHYLADAVGVSEVLYYFNELKDSKRWAEHAAEIAIQYMRDGFYEDGVQNELSPSYHSFCLNLGVILAQTLKVYTKKDLFKEPWFREIYDKGLQWISSLQTPDGGVVAFNDCHPTQGPSLLRLGASLFQNSHYQWFADEIKKGTSRQEKDNPDHCRVRFAGDFFHSTLHFDPTVAACRDLHIKSVFPQGGTACFRHIKNKLEGLLAQKCGRYTGGHAHADRLGFDFWHDNLQVLIEPGIIDQASLSSGGWYKSTTSHNVMAIYEPHEIGLWNSDEKFPVAHKNHRFSQGRFLKTEDNEQFSIMVSSAEIYAGIQQTRLLCWVKDSGLLLVADKIENETKESFVWDQLFHGQEFLESAADSFKFKANELSLKGFSLDEASEVVSLKRPEGVKGPLEYIAVRKEGSSLCSSTILIPYNKEEPRRPLLENGAWVLGEQLAFSQMDNSFKLERENKVLWES